MPKGTQFTRWPLPSSESAWLQTFSLEPARDKIAHEDPSLPITIAMISTNPLRDMFGSPISLRFVPQVYALILQCEGSGLPTPASSL